MMPSSLAPTRRSLLLGLGALALPFRPVLAADEPTAPLGYYLYDVVHEDRGKIGVFTTTLERKGEVLTATMERTIKVKVLGITAYDSYSHITQQLQGGRLIEMTRESDDDGKKSTLTIKLEGQNLKASLEGQTWTMPPDLLPTSPWNEEVIRRNRLIDIESGEPIDVTTETNGTTQVEAAGSMVAARSYLQRNGLNRDVWYDERGRLVRMKVFHGKNTVTMPLIKGP